MMYYHMIEEIEQERQEYLADRKKLFQKGTFGDALAIVNTKIHMCNRFITLLKSCEAQEMALEAENRMLKNQK